MLQTRAGHAHIWCLVLILLAVACRDTPFSRQETQSGTVRVVANEDYNVLSFVARVTGLLRRSGEAAAQRPSGLRIVGSGLSRTGTQTLKYSLQSLGYRCYHTEEIIMHNHTGLWLLAAPNTTAGHEALKEVAESILDLGYDCVMDFTWPWSARLVRLFPNARVIHTVRDSPEVFWLSFQRVYQIFALITISRPYRWLVSWDFMMPAVRDMFGISALDTENLDMAHPLPWVDIATPKTGVSQTLREQMIAAYMLQEELLTVVTPPGQLLVFNVKQGWGPLCSFLQVDGPCPEGPLPHLNKRVSFDIIEKILLAVCYAYPVLPLLPVVLAVGAFMVLRAVCCALRTLSLVGTRGKKD